MLSVDFRTMNSVKKIFIRLKRSRFRRDQRGIAAVEFALLLPLMLMIYMGLVELSRGMRAAQKMDIVAHALSDLTAQILPAANATDKTPATACAVGGQPAPCINETDVTQIFSAATTLMSGINDPNLATKMKMTITEVNIIGTPAGAPTSWTATVQWSVARNGAAVRSCGNLTPAASPPAGALGQIPQSYVTTSGGIAPPTGPIIIADVSYDYSPGVNFELFKWKSAPTWTMKRTQYAAVRNTFTPSHIRYGMTSGTNCNSPTP